MDLFRTITASVKLVSLQNSFGRELTIALFSTIVGGLISVGVAYYLVKLVRLEMREEREQDLYSLKTEIAEVAKIAKTSEVAEVVEVVKALSQEQRVFEAKLIEQLAAETSLRRRDQFKQLQLGQLHLLTRKLATTKELLANHVHYLIAYEKQTGLVTDKTPMERLKELNRMNHQASNQLGEVKELLAAVPGDFDLTKLTYAMDGYFINSVTRGNKPENITMKYNYVLDEINTLERSIMVEIITLVNQLEP